MPLNDDQVQAVTLATEGEKRVNVLTGAPGTGKTYTVRAIVDAFAAQGRRVRLAAPTGKAARRMTEQTGRMATTIHRLLEPRPVRGEDGKVKFRFTRDESKPIEGDAFIFDETSMLEVPLAHTLWRALPRHARILLVGDTNQLPPVGAGAFLMDLIASGEVPTVKLDKIMRQDGGGAIVQSCHAIKDGRVPVLRCEPDDDLQVLDTQDTEEILELIMDLVTTQITANPRFADLDKLKDIQVIAPTRDKGILSCLEINKRLQARLNPPPAEDTEPGRIRVNDKVIQTRNDYENGIVNGDIGFVKALIRNADNKEVFVVEFEGPDGKPFRVELMRYENHLELAYAITCHKFQGSEARAIIIPLHSSQPSILMQRSWIYTAISRARSLCVLVGERGMVGRAVRNHRAQRRTTHLADMLKTKG